MAITLNPATKVFSVSQADLDFISGTLYRFDTNVQRKAMWDLLSSEDYIWMPVAFQHNTEVTVAGVTYARTLEMINGYSITLEDTGSAYSVSFEGSNTNFFDIENGILNPTPLVTVQSNNSAGLQTVISGSGLDATQDDRLRELWQDKGFDAANPITVNESTGVVTVAGIIRTWAGAVIKTFTRTP